MIFVHVLICCVNQHHTHILIILTSTSGRWYQGLLVQFSLDLFIPPFYSGHVESTIVVNMTFLPLLQNHMTVLTIINPDNRFYLFFLRFHTPPFLAVPVTTTYRNIVDDVRFYGKIVYENRFQRTTFRFFFFFCYSAQPCRYILY